MKTVHKSVLIWYSAEEMYALVKAVPAYPEFLPWCSHARVVSEQGDVAVAEVGLSIGGIRQSFTTRNTHVPGQSIALQLVDGPFSQLEGHWQFTALAPSGEKTERACRVELQLSYGFDNAALAMLVGPVFDKIASSLVDAFVKRAGQVYG